MVIDLYGQQLGGTLWGQTRQRPRRWMPFKMIEPSYLEHLHRPTGNTTEASGPRQAEMDEHPLSDSAPPYPESDGCAREGTNLGIPIAASDVRRSLSARAPDVAPMLVAIGH
jgi:hypothetical protein